MKYLNKLLLTGMLSLLPLVSISPNVPKTYIPIENKLREIEKDSKGIHSNGCMHKAMRYYINVKQAGEDAYLIVGYLKNSEVWHAWVGINKNNLIYYVDPSFNNPNIDGFPKWFYLDRKEIYIFDSDITIKEFAYYKNIKERNREVRKDFNKKFRNSEIYTEELKLTLTESITNYCKQDTSAWNYYQENIAKNKE